ncbi:sulfide quinone-reductase [Penicillium waksmanii]|uniref:sulfide quinone-reductase n=1 Tax=Penicillium waksmanii TaxID=69791 RepID=UPI0025480F68|nr:sulfide quinone-reductase [Penicillium waksmanii]KAJ5963075.1 sulfide quinone-reductase [Penicillium waksmanii]
MAYRALRNYGTASPVSFINRQHRVAIVGGGAAGLSISHQLLRSGNFTKDDIAVIDPSTNHDYQPGWTLVGGGLKHKDDLRKSLVGLLDQKIKFYNEPVRTFFPEDNSITLGDGVKINYEQLVVVPGIKINYDSIQGLPEALSNPDSFVSTIYSYDTCDKVFKAVQKLQRGNAIFTQPTGIIKCAGAPQKAMWLALDYWKRAGLYNPSNPSGSPINISFATGLPSMFGVPKYSAKLEELRQQRGVEGLFQHDLVAISGNTAVFSGPGESSLASDAGFVDVDECTTRHTKYHNVWSIGDASNLPTSKTTAAITSQAPVLVENLLLALEGKLAQATYDGYTSCPLITEYGKVLLAEFKYGGVPKETFAMLGIDQASPRRAFYHLKKDFFSWVYYKAMVKGTWGGPRGWIRK